MKNRPLLAVAALLLLSCGEDVAQPVIDAGPISTPICAIGRDPAQPCHAADGGAPLVGACCILPDETTGRCVASGADALCDSAAALCAEHFGALPNAVCVDDQDCAAGQWCMVTCDFFHAVEQVNRCAPLKPAGAWCSHVGGDHECASGHCDPSDDACL